MKSDLLMNAWSYGESSFLELLANMLFPKRPAPALAAADEPRLRRKVWKILSDIGKVHAVESVQTLFKEVMTKLVKLVWPPQPEKTIGPPMELVLVKSGKSTRGCSAKNKVTQGALASKLENPADIYFTTADEVWWEREWFAYEREYWKTQRTLREQERAAYTAWWDYTLWWKEAWAEHEKNYWETQEANRELEREEYAEWWLKSLRYVEWWEKATAEPVQKRAAMPGYELPSADPFAGKRPTSNLLEELLKQKAAYNPVPARKKALSRAVSIQLAADADWWNSLLAGNAVDEDGVDYVQYLLRHNWSPGSVLEEMQYLLPTPQLRAWAENEHLRGNLHIPHEMYQAPEPTTSADAMRQRTVIDGNWNKVNPYAMRKERTYPGRNENDPLRPVSKTPTTASVLVDVQSATEGSPEPDDKASAFADALAFIRSSSVPAVEFAQA